MTRDAGRNRGWLELTPMLVGTVLTLTSTGCFNGPPAHGTAIAIEADVSGLPNEAEKQRALTQTLGTIRRRLESFGARFSVEPEGTQHLVVKVGTVSDAEMKSLRELVGRRGLLELSLVHQRSAELIAAGQTEPGYLTIEQKSGSSAAPERSRSLMVKQQPEMTNGIKRAMVMKGNRGEPEIAFTLDADGAKHFAQITGANIGRQLAIILDGQLYTAPVIQSPIEGGSGMITGQFDRLEAFELACVLENPLPIRVKIIEEHSF